MHSWDHLHILQNVGKGKKRKSEKQLLEYIDKHRKSVKWLDLKWLLERQGWIRLAKQCKGNDWVYKHPLLEALSKHTRIKGRPLGEKEPIEQIMVTVPHRGGIMTRRLIDRIIPKLKMVDELRYSGESQ